MMMMMMDKRHLCQSLDRHAIMMCYLYECTESHKQKICSYFWPISLYNLMKIQP